MKSKEKLSSMSRGSADPARIGAALVVVLALLSAALAAARVSSVSDKDYPCAELTLVPNEAGEAAAASPAAEEEKADEKSAASDASGSTSAAGDAAADGFAAAEGTGKDKGGIWLNVAEADIFSASYEGEDAVVSVASADGEKVLAPGTGSAYDFKVVNNASFSMDYTVTAEALVSCGDYVLPVRVRMTDTLDTYYLGSESEWLPAEDLSDFSDSATLAADHYQTYRLQWEWPYEGEDTQACDAYDTMLGDLAASGEELSLTVVLSVTASEDENPAALGGTSQAGGNWLLTMVKTGDIRLLFILLAVLLAAAALTAVCIRQHRKNCI